MSQITDVLILLECGERITCDEFNKFFVISNVKQKQNQHFKTFGLKPVPDYFGGNKAHQCEIFTGAFNYLDLDGFLAHVRTLDFEYPDSVQILVKEEYDERFRTISLRGE